MTPDLQKNGPLRSVRFSRLLVSLCLLLFASPFVGTFSNQLNKMLASLIMFVLLALVLVAAAAAVSDQRRHARIALILATACVASSLLNSVLEARVLSVVQDVLIVAFLAYVVLLIVRSLFQRTEADFDTIAASLCGYVLIGLLFAALYSIVFALDDSAFGGSETAKLHFGDSDMATILYFSFVTLTTLGYGDITPVSMPARMLTTVQALIGQIYLVVLVARLVGLHISSEIARRAKDE